MDLNNLSWKAKSFGIIQPKLEINERIPDSDYGYIRIKKKGDLRLKSPPMIEKRIKD